MKIKNQLIISAGYTGGHLFPAQSLAMQMKKNGITTTFVANGLKNNNFFDKNSFEYEEIPSGTLSRNLFKNLAAIFSIIVGIAKSFAIIIKIKPRAIIGFGSHHTFPVLFAGWMMKIPIILHEGNAIPSVVNKFFSPKAKICAVFIPYAAKFLKGNYIQTNFPLRENFYSFLQKKSEAYSYLNMTSDQVTIFLLGGSQGATAMNDIFLEACKMLISHGSHFQVIHIVGNNSNVESICQKYELLKIPHTVKTFEKNIHLAWQIADIVICRAGAGTIAEQIHMEVPAIFIPYPYAKNNHQEKNANFVANFGGGVTINQNEKNCSEILANSILSIIGSEKKLQSIKEAIKNFKNSQVADFSDTILKLLGYHWR